MNRYLVEVCEQKITPVTVIANTPQEAIERALRGEGDSGESWSNEAYSERVTELAV